jgi:hypothetical protein
MNAIELKTDLHKLIDKINDIDMLNAIRVLLKNHPKEYDSWDLLPSEVKESVEKSIVQAERGELKSHDEVMKAYKKWL